MAGTISISPLLEFSTEVLWRHLFVILYCLEMLFPWVNLLTSLCIIMYISQVYNEQFHFNWAPVIKDSVTQKIERWAEKKIDWSAIHILRFENMALLLINQNRFHLHRTCTNVLTQRIDQHLVCCESCGSIEGWSVNFGCSPGICQHSGAPFQHSSFTVLVCLFLLWVYQGSTFQDGSWLFLVETRNTGTSTETGLLETFQGVPCCWINLL